MWAALSRLNSKTFIEYHASIHVQYVHVYIYKRLKGNVFIRTQREYEIHAVMHDNVSVIMKSVMAEIGHAICNVAIK